MIFDSLNALASVVSKGPFLGIDWGKKRIGIALSDPENKIALPLKVLSTSFFEVSLRHLWQAHSPTAIILGWPLHMSGEESESCKKVRLFAEKLKKQGPVCLWDERLTTKSLRALAPLGIKEEMRDAHAAASLLQGALNQWIKINSFKLTYI